MGNLYKRYGGENHDLADIKRKDTRRFLSTIASSLFLYYTNNIYTTARKEVILIAITSASLPTKKRILTVCVKLFLEKGYKQTTLAEINEKAGVSFSQF